MNHWPFIIAAYAVTLLGTAALVLRSWSEMRNAESDVEGLKQ
jgi:hypothetical protein